MEALEEAINLAAELSPEANALVVVPLLSFKEISLGRPANDQLGRHRSCSSRALTSDQEEPDSGSRRQSSMRRSSSAC